MNSETAKTKFGYPIRLNTERRKEFISLVGIHIPTKRVNSIFLPGVG